MLQILVGICPFRIMSSDWTFLTVSFELFLVESLRQQKKNWKIKLARRKRVTVLLCVQKLVDRNSKVESQNHEDEKHFNSLTFQQRKHAKTLKGKRRQKYLNPRISRQQLSLVQWVTPQKLRIIDGWLVSYKDVE